MPDLDELLASMGEDEESLPDTEQQIQETPSIKQIREWGKAQERERKRLEKELAELRAFKQAQEEAARLNELTRHGLTEKQAKLWHLVNKDAEVTPEAVAAFRSEYLGLPTEPTGEQKQPAEPPPPAGFAPTDAGAQVPAKTYTHMEWLQIAAKDPAQARRLVEEGRVTDANPEFPTFGRW